MANGVLSGPGAPRTDMANIDLWSLVSRIDRMRREVHHSQSADLPSGLMSPDNARIVDFIADVRAFFEFVESKPLPDAPETHGGFALAIPDDTDIPAPQDIENEDCRSILFLLIQLRTEVQNSQSARLVQGVMPTPDGQPGDRARIKDFITRIENLVAYVAAQEPSDRPESTPMALPTTPGRTGT